VPPSAASSQTAWRVPRTARRKAPKNSFSLQVPPGGVTLTARHQRSSGSLLHLYRLAPKANRQALRYQTLSDPLSIAWRSGSLPPGTIPE